MKKTYIEPTSVVLNIHTEQCLLSLSMNISESAGTEQLSGGRGWDSSDWSLGDEE